MGFCIYHKKADPDLNFDKEEHVIPAGLGGKQKLEKGTVSDQANEKFSKEETVILRNSFIGLNRTNNGPGRRGSLSVKKVRTPVIRVIKGNPKHKQTSIEFKLGFIFAGKSYYIPQLATFMDSNSFTYHYLASREIVPSLDNLDVELNDKLIQFLEDKDRKFKLVNMPFTTDNHFIHIGLYKGRWYAATSYKVLNLNIFALDMLPILYELRKQYKDKKTISEPEFIEESSSEFKDKLNTDAEKFYFMYLKTAFNALALFKGTEFVCNEIFDGIRESIINVSDTGKFINFTQDRYNTGIETYIKNLPDKAHYVIISANNNELNAYVSFFSETPIIVELTSKYEGDDFIDGLICDWQNSRELKLEEL